VRLVDAAELSPLDPSGRWFLNVNTPDDLEAARRVLQEETCTS
jgi:molybdopterin-guanine dinucleotide biosynthesis protein A